MTTVFPGSGQPCFGPINSKFSFNLIEMIKLKWSFTNLMITRMKLTIKCSIISKSQGGIYELVLMYPETEDYG